MSCPVALCTPTSPPTPISPFSPLSPPAAVGIFVNVTFGWPITVVVGTLTAIFTGTYIKLQVAFSSLLEQAEGEVESKRSGADAAGEGSTSEAGRGTDTKGTDTKGTDTKGRRPVSADDALEEAANAVRNMGVDARARQEAEAVERGARLTAKKGRSGIGAATTAADDEAKKQKRDDAVEAGAAAAAESLRKAREAIIAPGALAAAASTTADATKKANKNGEDAPPPWRPRGKMLSLWLFLTGGYLVEEWCVALCRCVPCCACCVRVRVGFLLPCVSADIRTR